MSRAWAAEEGANMLTTLGGGVSLLLGLFAIVALVAALVAYARVALTKSTVEVLTDSNRALTERIDILERDKDRKDAEMVVVEAKLAKAEAETDVLRRLVTGRAEIEKLAEVVLAETKARQAEHHDILATIQASGEVVVALLRELQHQAHTHTLES